MLFIVFPVAVVLSTVCMNVDSSSMSFVIFPVTLINIAISVDQPALAISLVILPVALVQTAIRPDLESSTVPSVRSGKPLSLVLGIVLDRRQRPSFSLLRILVWVDRIVEILVILPISHHSVALVERRL